MLLLQPHRLRGLFPGCCSCFQLAGFLGGSCFSRSLSVSLADEAACAMDPTSPLDGWIFDRQGGPNRRKRTLTVDSPLSLGLWPDDADRPAKSPAVRDRNAKPPSADAACPASFFDDAPLFPSDGDGLLPKVPSLWVPSVAKASQESADKDPTALSHSMTAATTANTTATATATTTSPSSSLTSSSAGAAAAQAPSEVAPALGRLVPTRIGPPKPRAVVCFQCRSAHKKCDGQHPCGRCVAVNRASECCPADPIPKAPPAGAVPKQASGSKDAAGPVTSFPDALLQTAQTVEIVSAFSHYLVSSLTKHPEGLVATLGEDFVKCPADELERRILALTLQQFAPLDAWNESDVCLNVASEEFCGPSARPCVIYRHSSAYSYIHNRLLIPGMRFIVVSPRFVKEFGWTIDRFLDLKMEPPILIHPDDLPNILKFISVACLNTKAGDIPIFTAKIRFMRSDGTFVMCVYQQHIIRAANMVPIYSIVYLEQLSSPQQANGSSSNSM